MIRNRAHGQPCPYCRRQMDRSSFDLQPTRDHVIPRSRNGTIQIICCQKCNGVKADMMPDVWAAWMDANPGWWLLSRVELRAVRRGHRVPLRNRRFIRPRQGTAPLKPTVVPPELIFTERTSP